MWTMHPGEANGSLTLKFKGLMQGYDVLRFHPEIQAQLDEISKKGWKYLFIQIAGTGISEVKVQTLPYRLRIGSSFTGRAMPPPPILEVTFLNGPPDLTGIPEVHEFRINVCSKSFPRAVVLDLAKGAVTYIHDALWKWDKNWATDGTKLSEAKEVFEVATWLVDEKRYKLADSLDSARYQELVGQFRGPPK